MNGLDVNRWSALRYFKQFRILKYNGQRIHASHYVALSNIYMKRTKKVFLFGIIILIISCTNKKGQDIKQIDTSGRMLDTIYNKSSLQEDILLEKTSPSIWKYDYMEDTIIRLRIVLIDTLSTDNLIAIINRGYIDKVILDFVKVSSDTIYVTIKDSEYLTQRMGSAGSMDYMITTTFTLTELKDIHYVNFSFDYGDHASPGTYSRQYYLDLISSNKMINTK